MPIPAGGSYPIDNLSGPVIHALEGDGKFTEIGLLDIGKLPYPFIGMVDAPQSPWIRLADALDQGDGLPNLFTTDEQGEFRIPHHQTGCRFHHQLKSDFNVAPADSEQPPGHSLCQI